MFLHLNCTNKAEQNCSYFSHLLRNKSIAISVSFVWLLEKSNQVSMETLHKPS